MAKSYLQDYRNSLSTAMIQEKTLSDIKELFKSQPKALILVSAPEDFGDALVSDKVYLIDGAIDMTGVSLEIPSGGVSIIGYTFDVSKLISSDDNYTMFTSPVGGSGNVLITDVGMEASGLSSQLFDLKSATGFDAIEFNTVNFNNCTKIGVIDNYRQGLEAGTGRFGGTPTIEFVGIWVGGYFIETSIVRSIDNAMTEPLFKAGAGFDMKSRFRSNMNVDLGTTAAFFDFQPSNFPNPSTIQLNGCLISRNGIFNSEDATVTPNITSGDIASRFKENIGIDNTFEGGRCTISAEIATSISLVNDFYDLDGTWAVSNLQHFDSPANGQLRHTGDSPREFRLFAELSIDGTANRDLGLRIRKWDDSASVFVDTTPQIRPVNNFSGGRDVAFFTLIEEITLDKNDYIIMQIQNITDSSNVTVELDSFWFIAER